MKRCREQETSSHPPSPRKRRRQDVTGIDDLPDELLFITFQQLPPVQRLNCLPFICQRWKRIAYDPSLHPDFDVRKLHDELCGDTYRPGSHYPFGANECPFHRTGLNRQVLLTDVRLCKMKRLQTYFWEGGEMIDDHQLKELVEKLPFLEEIRLSDIYSETTLANSIALLPRLRVLHLIRIKGAKRGTTPLKMFQKTTTLKRLIAVSGWGKHNYREGLPLYLPQLEWLGLDCFDIQHGGDGWLRYDEDGFVETIWKLPHLKVLVLRNYEGSKFPLPEELKKRLPPQLTLLYCDEAGREGMWEQFFDNEHPLPSQELRLVPGVREPVVP